VIAHVMGEHCAQMRSRMGYVSTPVYILLVIAASCPRGG